MIQRIQSLFLLLTSAGFFSLLKFPFATSDTSIPDLMKDNMYNIQDHIILLILTTVGGLLALAMIFLYSNRALQIKLNNVLIIFSILLPLLAFLLIYNEGTAMIQSAQINDGPGLYILGAILLFSVLSLMYIKKDKQLVESMDRLR
ncbi:MAG: DUF4293 family protein [Saprospiraceae bacterium]|nr:DUF4293 family protein [Saprospiraceae bacterium]